jgi:hypothetical protein
MRIAHIACCLLLMAAAGIADTQLAVVVPGTNVQMTPPPGWTAAKTFPGFQHDATGSTIRVQVRSATPYQRSKEDLTQQALARQGMELLGQSPTTYWDLEGSITTVKQTIAGVTCIKLLGCFGTSSVTVWITGTTQEAYQEQMRVPMLAAIITARLLPKVVSDSGTSLPFSVKPADAYIASSTISDSSMVCLIRKDAPTPARRSDATYIVATSIGRPPGDIRTLARNRLQTSAATFKNMVVKEVNDVFVDGVRGVETIATAQYEQSRISVLLYQVYLLDKDRYYLIQGHAPIESAAELDLWRQMTQTFCRRNK